MKYYVLRIKERNGEFENDLTVLLESNSNKTPKRLGLDYLSNFFGEPKDGETKTYDLKEDSVEDEFCERVATFISIEEIPLADYIILKKYRVG